jgi:hypothetical protein
MTQRNNSVRTGPVVSDERFREEIRLELDRSINIDRRFTRKELAEKSGVNIHTIDQLLSRQVEKHRRIALEDAMSLAWVLGERAINAVLAVIGFVASPVDDPDEISPAQIVADGLADFSVIATAAADGRIDHVERPRVRDAADHLIATVLPLSSHGQRQ